MSSSSWYEEHRRGWNVKVDIQEYGFDVYQKAEAALYGFCLFILVGIALWAVLVRRSRNEVFKLRKIWLPIVLTIIYYAFAFAYRLVEQHEYEVTWSYILVQAIFMDLLYLAEIALLAIIFSLLFELLQRPRTASQRHRGILYVHYTFCAFLFFLYITIFGLEVRELYTQVYYGEPTVYWIHDKPVRSVLHVTYDVLYACASIEVFVASIIASNLHRNYQANRTIPLLVLTLIAFPLLITRLFTLGYNAAYELGDADFISMGVTIAQICIAGLANILAFAGFVAVGRQPVHVVEPHLNLENRTVQQGDFSPSHAPPSSEPYLPDKTGGERSRAARSGFVGWKDRLVG